MINKNVMNENGELFGAEKMRVKLTFLEPVLGTSPQNAEIYKDFIHSKAPDASTLEEEIAALGEDDVSQKGITIFPKANIVDDNGVIVKEKAPFLYDYQIRGFFKGACGFLRDVPKTKSSTLKSYKKRIDGLFFAGPRKIFFDNFDDTTVGLCQRPLRAQTMQGERVSLACSEEIPAGATITFDVWSLYPNGLDYIKEWFDYGRYSGIGQWRNSGKGRFTWEIVDEG